MQNTSMPDMSSTGVICSLTGWRLGLFLFIICVMHCFFNMNQSLHSAAPWRICFRCFFCVQNVEIYLVEFMFKRLRWGLGDEIIKCKNPSLFKHLVLGWGGRDLHLICPDSTWFPWWKPLVHPLSITFHPLPPWIMQRFCAKNLNDKLEI